MRRMPSLPEMVQSVPCQRNASIFPGLPPSLPLTPFSSLLLLPFFFLLLCPNTYWHLACPSHCAGHGDHIPAPACTELKASGRGSFHEQHTFQSQLQGAECPAGQVQGVGEYVIEKLSSLWVRGRVDGLEDMAMTPPFQGWSLFLYLLHLNLAMCLALANGH